MRYEVKIEVFEGPIDLLLHLITRRRVDIYDVSLATITEEYLEAIGRLDSLDLETATGFLVVAATLLELKSARLLPNPQALQDDAAGLLEERDLLLARLVECATFRTAGEWLNAELKNGEAYLPRTAGLEPAYAELAPDVLAGIDLSHLAVAAGRALAPRPTYDLDLSHIAPIRASVRDCLGDLASRLEAGGTATFEALCGPARPRIEVVVRFLALLELYKLGAVDLEQSERFGDIRAVWTGDVRSSVVTIESDEYDGEPAPGGAL